MSKEVRWKRLFNLDYWKAIPLLQLILSLKGSAGSVVTPDSRTETIAQATKEINKLTGRDQRNSST